MGTVHQILEAHGKTAALQSGLDRDVVEAASLYMSDEDSNLSFAFSGWAQCALPHRQLSPESRWEIAGERVRLVVEPGLRPGDNDGPMEPVGVPYGSVARLILLFLQTEALRRNSREVELGGSLRQWLTKIGVSIGGITQGPFATKPSGSAAAGSRSTSKARVGQGWSTKVSLTGRYSSTQPPTSDRGGFPSKRQSFPKGFSTNSKGTLSQLRSPRSRQSVTIQRHSMSTSGWPTAYMCLLGIS